MPKAYSDAERLHIKKRLIEEAEACLTQYGIRKTSVDELVKRVNIPKGTFYLFYPSKEMLFFEVFNTLHDKIQTDLLRRLDGLRNNVNVESLSDLIFQFYKQMDSTFMYSFMASGELDLLIRKLPPEITEAHVHRDDFNMEQLLAVLPGKHSDNAVKLFSAALRAIFFMMSHRREIGVDIFDETIRLMLRGVITQLFEEEIL